MHGSGTDWKPLQKIVSSAPDDQHHHHHGRDLHDPQSFFAGLVNPDDVLAPEIKRDHDGEESREIFGMHVDPGLWKYSPISLMSPARYSPALTPLMGPVST